MPASIPAPLERRLSRRTRTNDLHLARCRSVLIGQIKKEPEFTCCCCLSPWVGIKQAAKHLFTMSIQPATDAQKASRSPNLLSDLRRSRFSVGLGGAGRNRTDDILLAKQTLSQLSYGPIPENCQPELAAKAGGPG